MWFHLAYYTLISLVFLTLFIISVYDHSIPQEREFNALRDFKYVLSKVEKVKLFVKPEDKEETHSLPLHYCE